MLRPAKILLVGTSVATVAFATAASSQEASRIDNVQLSTGDVFAGQTLNVIDPADGVSVTTGASGNAASVHAEGEDVDLTSAQLSHSVRANTEVEVHGWTPHIEATSAAVGSQLHVQMQGGALKASTDQAVGQAESLIEAKTYVSAEKSSSGDTTATAAAVGNDQFTQMDGGYADIRSGQYHYGAGTNARVDAKLFHVKGAATLTASAAANQHGLDGYADEARLDLDQVSTGSTTATVTAEVENGQTLTATSAAAANTVSAANSGGALDVTAVQNHDGYTRAETYLSAYQYGEAVAMAAATGNSVSADLHGPTLTLNTDQVNSGGVEAEVGFFGGHGYDATLTATAIGNAVSGYACTECDGALTATNNQVNSGHVTASTHVDISGSARTTHSSASAVGNSASYYVTRPKH